MVEIRVLGIGILGIVLKYTYFQTVCTQNNASVEWSYFPQKCIKFHLQLSRFDNFFPGRNPRLLLTGVGKGLQFVLLKEGEVRKGGKRKRKGGKGQR